MLKIVLPTWLLYSNMIAPSGGVALAFGLHSPLYGNWRVDSFERNGVIVPEAVDQPARWREVAIGRRGDAMFVRTMDDSAVQVLLTLPPGPLRGHSMLDPRELPRSVRQAISATAAEQGVLAFTVSRTHRGPLGQVITDSRSKVDTLRYARAGTNVLALDGPIDGAHVRVRMHRIPVDSLPFFRHRWKPL